MKLFVTVATGFIGSYFINVAHKLGYEIVGLRREGSHSRIKLDIEPIWIKGSLEGDYSEILNVGTGEPKSVLEFSKYWWKKWDATAIKSWIYPI